MLLFLVLLLSLAFFGYFFSSTLKLHVSILVVAAIIVCLMFLVAFTPINGFEGKLTLIDEFELVPLSLPTKYNNDFIYIVSNGVDEYTYSYLFSDPSFEFENNIIETDTINDINVIIREFSGKGNATLKIYRQKAFTTLYTLGLCWKIFYVFYIPENGLQFNFD